jgi:hypothetical protein
MSVIRVLEVEGVPFELLAGEERVRDVALGEVLGYGRPRDIRPLIERNLDDLPGIYVRGTVSRTSMPRGGERETEGEEYLLTLDEALFVAARSETPAGAAVLKRLIHVFRLAREGRLGEAGAVAGAPPAAPPLDVEQIVLLVARVAATVAADVVASSKGGRRRAPAPAQGDLFTHLGRHDAGGPRREPRPEPWRGAVEAYLAGLAPGAAVTTFDVFTHALGRPTDECGREASTRIGGLLRGAGWVVERRRPTERGRVRHYVRAHQGSA